MGATVSRIAKRFGFLPQCRLRILMVGLDSSGKTTILYKLKLGDLLKTKPTIGTKLTLYTFIFSVLMVEN